MSAGPKPRGGLPEASPRTRALEVLIQASLDQLLDETPAKANEGLLFLGNWHDALPRLLIQDPILQPVDKVVWQVIKLQATAQGATGFPTYDQIARWANVASDATVARAISILRSTRWLTLCVQKARTRKGRFRGNVYALHDEPLALGDTLHLDPEYMQFLCRLAAKSGDGRVGEVAKAVLGSIELDIQEGIDITAPRDAMTERMEAMRFITAAPGQAGEPAQRVFGVRRGFAMTLQSRVKDGVQTEVQDSDEEAEGRNLDLFAPEVHLQNLKMDENSHLQKMKMGNRLQKMKLVPQPQNLTPQNLGSPSALGSSGSKNITTTTTYLDGLDNKSARAREDRSCVGPTQPSATSLSDSHSETIERQSAGVTGCVGPTQPNLGRGGDCIGPIQPRTAGAAEDCIPGIQQPAAVRSGAGEQRLDSNHPSAETAEDCIPGIQQPAAVRSGAGEQRLGPNPPASGAAEDCKHCLQPISGGSLGSVETGSPPDSDAGSRKHCLQSGPLGHSTDIGFAEHCVPGTQQPTASASPRRLPGNQPDSIPEGHEQASLQFPPELSRNEIVLAGMQVAKVPADLQQEVLDLLGDRIRAAAAGTMEPLIFGPLGYLRTLCLRAIAGTLIRRNRVVQVAARPSAAPTPAAAPMPVDEDAVRLKNLRDEHFNALQWKQKLERIGPGRNPTDEQLRVHQGRVGDAAGQLARLSQQIQELLAQRPDLRPVGSNGDRPPVPPPAPGARQ